MRAIETPIGVDDEEVEPPWHLLPPLEEPADEYDFDALVEAGPAWALRAEERMPVIIPGVLGAGGLAMMISDPKAGKTWLTLELVVCVATGANLFGRYPVELPGRILYIATEGSREGTLARLRAVARGHALDVDHVLAEVDFIWRRGVQLDDETFVGELVRRAWRYRLIIVDVLVEAWRGNENHSAEVSKLMRRLRPATDAGATVLLLHHLAKQQADDHRSIWQRIRGSTAFFGAFDSGIGLERPQGALRTRVSFQHRDDAPAAAFSFAWPAEFVTGEEAVSLDWRADGAAELAALQAAELDVLAQVRNHEGLAMREVAGAIKGRRKAENETAVKALLAAGQLVQREVEGRRSDGRLYRRQGLFVASPELWETVGDGGAAMQGLASPMPVGGSKDPPRRETTPARGSHRAGDGRADRNRFQCPACQQTASSPGPDGAFQRRCYFCGHVWAPEAE